MRKALPMDASIVFEPKVNLLERTYRAYKAELCRYIERQFGQGPPEAEEVVQAAFARFAALEKPQEIVNARAFLYACSRNVVLDTRRRDRVRDAALLDEAMANPGDGPANLDIERVLIGREQLAIVETVVRAMETKRRRVFIMHAIHGMRYVDIANAMHLSEARIRQLMASALAECQRAIDSSSSLGDVER